MEHVKSASHVYKLGRVLGNGSFGTVCEAICTETSELVAIKKVLQDPRYKNRELTVMKQLYHPNVIALNDFFFTESMSSDNASIQRYLSLVMQHMPQNLYKLIRDTTKDSKTGGIEYPYVQVYTYQILRSLGYIHSLGLCHRDLKPQNILVNPETHMVKLCDFGSAKRLHPGEVSVSYICSRYYRAPELMLGSSDYTCSIDVWSVGCVLGEMLLGKPMFAGRTSIEQLVKIIQILGAPSHDEIVHMNDKYSNFKFPAFPPKDIKTLFNSKPNLPEEIFELLRQMLKFVPTQRILPYDALASPVFDNLRNENFVLPDGTTPPPLFNFSEHELAQMSATVLERILPPWLLEKNLRDHPITDDIR